jgi:membrane protein YqaA with SNARE-associated domain
MERPAEPAFALFAAIGNIVGDVVPLWFKIGTALATSMLLIGQLLCWRAGWKRFNAESAPFAGKRVDKFVVYVAFAPFSLPFSDITFPKWGFWPPHWGQAHCQGSHATGAL